MVSFDELFALRVTLQDEYTDEADIIRQLKSYLLQSMSLEEIDQYLHEFYNSFGINIPIEELRDVRLDRRFIRRIQRNNINSLRNVGGPFQVSNNTIFTNQNNIQTDDNNQDVSLNPLDSNHQPSLPAENSQITDNQLDQILDEVIEEMDDNSPDIDSDEEMSDDEENNYGQDYDDTHYYSDLPDLIHMNEDNHNQSNTNTHYPNFQMYNNMFNLGSASNHFLDQNTQYNELMETFLNGLQEQINDISQNGQNILDAQPVSSNLRMVDTFVQLYNQRLNRNTNNSIDNSIDNSTNNQSIPGLARLVQFGQSTTLNGNQSQSEENNTENIDGVDITTGSVDQINSNQGQQTNLSRLAFEGFVDNSQTDISNNTTINDEESTDNEPDLSQNNMHSRTRRRISTGQLPSSRRRRNTLGNNQIFSQLVNSAIFPRQLQGMFNHLPMNTQAVHMDDVRVTLQDKDLESIKTIKFSEINDPKIDEKKCSICMTKFADDDDISILKCNHIFHEDCIKEWLKDYNYKCPVCRCETGEAKYDI
tara:strand:+ start:760 stop:2361 length:1602 start_codon:yes stop_codon:yes gene_type:complete